MQAGSGFLSQHSKELLIGLGASERIVKLTVSWPSGETQVFTDVPLNTRLRIVEGGRRRDGGPRRRDRRRQTTSSAARCRRCRPRATWMYEPFPAPDFSLPDVAGRTRSLAALKGKPAVVLLWSPDVAAARAALETLGRGAEALTRAGVGSIAIAVDAPQDQAIAAACRQAPRRSSWPRPKSSLSYAILNRHLFMNRQDLRLPTCLLLDASGNVVKVYRDRVDVDQIVKDASHDRRVSGRAARPSRALSGNVLFRTAAPQLPAVRPRTSRQGLEAAAVTAFERAAQANPGASTLYRLGTLLARSGETVAAPAPRSSAPSPCSRISPRPTTISERCSRRAAISTGRSAGFVRRWRRLPTIPTR